MKKDMLNRFHYHKSFNKNIFHLWLNWRPAVPCIGLRITFSSRYIEFDLGVYINITIAFIWGK